MNLFIDCEWNGFKGDLISMALVDEAGRSWYEVLYCQDPCDWVRDNVMPVLNKKYVSLYEMQRSLQGFLCSYSWVHIIADWPEDIQWFCKSLIIAPGHRISTPALTMEVRRDLDAISIVPHNALEDAKAIANAYDILFKNR